MAFIVFRVGRRVLERMRGADFDIDAERLRTTVTSPSTPKTGINHGHGDPLSARTSSGSPSQ